MDEFLPVAVHEEYARRMEDEHRRQNRRIENLEETVTQIGDLTVSVSNLATSVKQMVDIQKEQSDRLKNLEARDGEMWRKVVAYAATFIVGAVLSFLLSNIGL